MKIFVLLTILGIAFASNVQASTNEQFAYEVERHVAAFEQDEKTAESARQFCSSLSEARRDEEPRCVALQKLVRRGQKFTPTPHRKF